MSGPAFELDDAEGELIARAVVARLASVRDDLTPWLPTGALVTAAESPRERVLQVLAVLEGRGIVEGEEHGRPLGPVTLWRLGAQAFST